MDPMKETLQYAVELAKPNIVEDGIHRYIDKDMSRLDIVDRARAIKLHTLTSFIEYVKNHIDKTDGQKMILHVVSPTEVSFFTQLDMERGRETVVNIEAKVPAFAFNKFIGQEEFIIGMQSKFIDDELFELADSELLEDANNINDKALVLKFAGTMQKKTVQDYGDDGVSQKAAIKTGLAAVEEAIIPNPVTLIPYRTFLEVKQPSSKFIFRATEDRMGGGILLALFDADGGAWEYAAMERIKEYLRKELADEHDITVIS